MREMTSAEFNEMLDWLNEQLAELRAAKGGEYATNDDVLANLKRNAKGLDLTPEEVWGVYAGKHWDSIQTYIRDLGANVNRVRTEPIIGRAMDLIVYLQLFVAMHEARQPVVSAAQKEPDDLKLFPLLPSPRSWTEDQAAYVIRQLSAYKAHSDAMVKESVHAGLAPSRY